MPGWKIVGDKYKLWEHVINSFSWKCFIRSGCFSLRVTNGPTSCIQLPLKVELDKVNSARLWDDALMMCSWCRDDTLNMQQWWCTDDVLIDDALMMCSWCADEVLIMCTRKSWRREEERHFVSRRRQSEHEDLIVKMRLEKFEMKHLLSLCVSACPSLNCHTFDDDENWLRQRGMSAPSTVAYTLNWPY